MNTKVCNSGINLSAINHLLNSGSGALRQIKTVAGRSQARFATTIVLLGGGDAGVTHRILHRDEILAVIKHGGGKRSPQIVRCAFRNTRQLLAHLQDMVHRLIGQPVVHQGVKPSYTGEQRPGFFPPHVIDP